MTRFRCLRCLDDDRKPLEFAALAGNCPRCGRESAWQLVDVHFITLGDGPIQFGDSQRQQIACMPDRVHLALHANDMFSASGSPVATTCPACMRTKAWLQAAAVRASTDRKLARRLVQITGG